METRFGPATVTYSPRGIPTYRAEAFHDGLHKYALMRASDLDTLRNKLEAQAQQWDARWTRQCETEAHIKRTHLANEAHRLHIEKWKVAALEQTTDAHNLLETLRTLLKSGIEIDPSLDWEKLKITTPFPEKIPRKSELPSEPSSQPVPPAPDRSSSNYQLRFSLLDYLSRSRKEAKRAEASRRFDADMHAWNANCAALIAEHQARLKTHRANVSELRARYVRAVAEWEARKLAHEEEEAKQHAAIDELHKLYEAKLPDAVVEHCERVLSKSEYPSCIPRGFDFELNHESGVLLLNCRLPAPDDLPTLAEVKYVQTTDALSEKFLSEAQCAKLYDDTVYQIALRTIHELFYSDSVGAISTVVFNGIVTSTDKGTGNQTTACILSVQVSRDIFLGINLAKVDPKMCFRQLRGVGSSKLHSITPVAPIAQLSRDDSRFVTAHVVAERLDQGSNLAAMDWEDFEHLIREIFEKEFSYSGGEVKVTQASRDGGVDAVAFDPDPIRGGKVVIQAKRYAYTVGVSAVRDLYGTLMNEGANKGILVTTSDYGPDAYEFANGKPLTLLSGSNLLHLLEKHGISGHINLNEARKLAHERSARDAPQ
jgi:restriction system protein